jgi:uncharacterized membrane-anchored protein
LRGAENGFKAVRLNQFGNIRVQEGSTGPEFETRPTGSVMGFPAHEARPGALGEVHSRPYPLVTTPRALVQLSFMTEGGSVVDQAVLSELSRRLGIAAPDRQARHHAMKWGKGTLRWERHTEFSADRKIRPSATDFPRPARSFPASGWKSANGRRTAKS